MRRRRRQTRFGREYPSATKRLPDDLEARLNHVRVAPAHRKYARTTNLLERTFEEERRRTNAIPRFWTEHSARKLILGTLDRPSRRWQRRTWRSNTWGSGGGNWGSTAGWPRQRPNTERRCVRQTSSCFCSPRETHPRFPSEAEEGHITTTCDAPIFVVPQSLA
ncbi:MAG: transposase [Clostridia bacterium]